MNEELYATPLAWDYTPDTYWTGDGRIQGDENWTRGLPAIPQGCVGEYLPRLGEGEVEIVLIRLQSTTGDVLSVRASPDGEKIAYRVVDEYEGMEELSPSQCTAPLSLRELSELLLSFVLQGEGPYLRGLWEQGLSDSDPDHRPDDWVTTDIRDFVDVTSEFYPSLASWYDAAFAAWARHRGLSIEPEDQTA